MIAARLVAWTMAVVVAGAGAARAADGDGIPPAPRTRFAVLPDQWRGEPRPSPALAVPSPVTRDDKVQDVTLKEAIALALENNPRIAARRLEPSRLLTGVQGAQAQFDPLLSGDVTYNHTETPTASSLAGNPTLITDDRSANVNLSKLFRSGATLSLFDNNDRLDQNSRFIGLRPQYHPEVGFSLTQPLLRNLGWNFSYLVVRVSEEQADAAAYQYEADLADFVQEVIVAYWSVVGAREAVRVQEASLELANTTTHENEARVNVGLLAPVAVLEAQADAKSREAQLLVAENDLAITRQRLSQLAFYRPEGTFVPRTLEPIEEVAPEPLKVGLDDTLNAALASRPEIEASKRGVTVTQLNERISSNALLPRLDVVGSYGYNALAGSPRAGSTTLALVPSDEVPLLRSRGCSCTMQPCPLPASQCPVNPLFNCNCPTPGRNDLAGGLGDAYGRLGDTRSYSAGIHFEIPFANAAAESQLAQSRIARDQAELNHRELLSQITLEVRQAVSDVQTAAQRIAATRVATQLAEENLRNQEQRHSVGIATTKDLLDFQSRLTAARFAEVSAKVDYATAVARWRRAQGRLLDHYQIVVERPGRHARPWYTWF